MARKGSSTISQGELYPHSDEAVREELDDARLLDLDVEEESPFLRGQKRVSVRRSSLPKKTATRLSWIALAAVVVFLGSVAVAALYHYGEHSWRFRIESSDDIEISGLGNVTRPQVMEVLGEDIGRNVFFIPLSQRKRQLEQIPWVESASVMRFVPNRLKIEIHERTPVAFSRIGSKIFLIDVSGALMELPPANRKKRFSFPVILGMNLGEPQSMRAARMKTYQALVTQLDSSGAHYSQDLSEVDLSDAEDVKVLANDAGGEVLVHLGSSDYLDRFKIYKGHAQEWRQQFARLDSVDLRYEHQIVVNPDLQGTIKEPPLAMSAVRSAMAAGVKPAALVSHMSAKSVAATPPAPAGKQPGKSLASKKKTWKARRRQAALKKTTASSSVPVGTLAKVQAQSQPPAAQKSDSKVTSNAAKPGPKPSPAVPKEQTPP